MPWSPYIYVSHCNHIGLNCKFEGYLIDLVNIWGKELNFTLTIHQDTEGDWGTTPKSGNLTSCNINTKYSYKLLITYVTPISVYVCTYNSNHM